MKNSDDSFEEYSELTNEKSYELENNFIVFQNDNEIELDIEDITKVNKPYRDSFTVPIEHIIRTNDNDKSRNQEI